MIDLLLSFAIAAGPPAFDTTVAEDQIAILCDTSNGRVSVRASADQASLDRSYNERRVIAVESLFDPQGGASNGVNSPVKAPLVRYERCGPLAIRLTGAAYNLNPNGEDGAFPDFASLVILGFAYDVYPERGEPEIRLTQCARKWRNQNCPADYAVRVDARSWGDGLKVDRYSEVITYLEDPEDKPQIVSRTDQVWRRAAAARTPVQDDPDTPWQIGAWSVSCMRDGQFRGGVQTETCGATVRLSENRSLWIKRTPDWMRVYVGDDKCNKVVAKASAMSFHGSEGARGRRLSELLLSGITDDPRATCGVGSGDLTDALKIEDLATVLSVTAGLSESLEDHD